MSELEKAKPEVEVELDGKVRLLKYDWWALSLVEEEAGLGFLNPAATGERLTLNKLVILVWAGLLHEMPFLRGRSSAQREDSFRKIADWIFKAGKTDEVTAKVLDALGRAFPAEKQAEQHVNGEAKNVEPVSESPGSDTSPLHE
jgi:hypothetical protein